MTDISPDARVKMSMNEINASRRLREAAKEKAEADKIVQVKAAEADAESKYLSGVGVARQRQAIVGGLQDSIIEFSGEIAGTTPKTSWTCCYSTTSTCSRTSGPPAAAAHRYFCRTRRRPSA